MRVTVDAKRCQGHGMCNMVCPEVFKYDDDGFAHVNPKLDVVSGELVEKVKLAEIQCPERAVAITDNE